MADLLLTLEPSSIAELEGSTEGTYTQNLEHVLEGISHFTELFKHGPRNQAMAAALLDQVQELEDAIWDVFQAFDPDTAVGNALDLLGQLVGEPRLERVDDEFRTAIRVRVLVNASDGKTEQLYAILAGIFGAFETPPVFRIYETYPLTIAAEIVGDPGAVTIETIHRLLTQAKAGGVRLDTILAAEGAGTGDYTGIWAIDDDQVVGDRDDPGDLGVAVREGWNDETNWGLNA